MHGLKLVLAVNIFNASSVLGIIIYHAGVHLGGYGWPCTCKASTKEAGIGPALWWQPTTWGQMGTFQPVLSRQPWKGVRLWSILDFRFSHQGSSTGLWIKSYKIGLFAQREDDARSRNRGRTSAKDCGMNWDHKASMEVAIVDIKQVRGQKKDLDYLPIKVWLVTRPRG